ncbi:MAG: hypothetical protein ABIJ60_00320, partial [Patescibacteria group bacterium]
MSKTSGGFFLSFLILSKEFAAKEKFEIVKDRGEAAQSFNFVQDRIFGGFSSPPQAAKCVRTILRIQH